MEILSSRTIVHPTDLDRSIDFYGRTLGLAVAREFGQGEGRGVVFFTGGGLIEVVAGREPAGPTEPGEPARTPVALWLQVRSAEAALAELAERGVPVARPARLEPWGLVEAWIDDPDGLRIHLVEVPPDHPLRRDTRGSAGGELR
ncbi:MAG TPA: VOC family protein [Acidimicrobiales bacterium]|nr:VOC family protein [Acidimicrobiales bacterium]